MKGTIIVTGGAGGIGSEICQELARDGLKVVVADFDEGTAAKLGERIRQQGGEAVAIRVDVGDKTSVAALVQQAIERYQTIDFLINAAGVMTRVPVLEMAEADWDRVMRINVKGVFLCSQAVGAHMVKNKHGRIINVASGRGLAGQPRAAHYAASKAAVIGFTKSLAMELAPANVTVNAIAPGATDTPMARAGSTEEEWKRREAVPPIMGGLTKKEEIVGLVRYLLSDAAKYITGQTFLLRTPTVRATA
ncbi:MAG: SDR family NAD(P)-dependent oxidoreductase [Candidatus Binatia bacterium]